MDTGLPVASPPSIRFRDGYAYQLEDAYVVQTPIVQAPCEVLGWVRLHHNGLLEFARGYAWDGASGPAVDTSSFMRGALCHDGLTQLVREGRLSESWLPDIHAFLGAVCREDGMSTLRSWYVVLAVGWFGDAIARRPKPVQVAP